jgi:hypothetical protein
MLVKLSPERWLPPPIVVFVPATSLSKDGEVGGALCGMVLEQKVGMRTLSRCRLNSKLLNVQALL